MNPEVWKVIWNEFCDSQTHLDSLLSKIPPSFGSNAKAEVAKALGAFLRRPWTLSQALGISLDENPAAFWNQNFISLRKNEAIHQVFEKLGKKQFQIPNALPNEGTLHDFPPALTEQWRKDWGPERAARFAALLSQDPLTVIRLSRHAIEDADALFPRSRAGRFSPRARVFKGYEAVLGSEAYQSGNLEIQDEGSQVMAAFALYPATFSRCLSDFPQTQKKELELILGDSLPILKSSLTVIDACAGAGGKTLALADLMKGQGRVFAYDIYEKKIQSLKRRAKHAKENNIQGVALTEELLQNLKVQFKESADIILADCPCSGQGVLRRNPDMKWNRKPHVLEQQKTKDIEVLQREILMNYLPLLKVNGRLVYGVCTFQKSETTEQLEWIIDQAKLAGIQLKLHESGFIGPYETDGFFMASFERMA